MKTHTIRLLIISLNYYSAISNSSIINNNFVMPTIIADLHDGMDNQLSVLAHAVTLQLEIREIDGI